MKKILILLLMLISIFATAQDKNLGNFKITEKIVWQKVYEYPEEDSLHVKNFFFQNHLFNYKNDVGTTYITLKDYTDAEFGERPVYFNNISRIIFIVQIKNNRYRVTVLSLSPVDSFVGLNLIRTPENATFLNNFFDFYIKKDGQLKSSFTKVASLLDNTLSSIFFYKNSKPLDDDF